MKIIIAENYDGMSELAKEIFIKTIREKPTAVLGLATGTTPLGLYKRLIDDFNVNGTSYKNVTAVNLDEYKGLPKTHKQSYAYFMKTNLFDGIDIDRENTHIENGEATDERAECDRYDGILDRYPRDIQLLGLGSNGHIAFNEPGTAFDSRTHTVKLDRSTINDNSRLFDDISEVPTDAFTMGIRDIMSAKKILVLACGENKAEAVLKTVKGEINNNVPASILQLHPDCTLILDKAAARLLEENDL